MPMIWNAEADARLFAGVLATADVKVDYNKLAAYMGPECTAKALTHRIANIKKLAKDAGQNAIATAPPPTGKKRKGKDASSATDTEDTPAKNKRASAKTGAKAKKTAVETPYVRSYLLETAKDNEADEEDNAKVEDGVKAEDGVRTEDEE